MKTSDIKVEYITHSGNDLSVVNAARVSFNKESSFEFAKAETIGELDKLLKDGWENATEADDYYYHASRLKPGDAKLVAYLAKHKHFSPFNHAFITLRIKAPIYCARQLVKHKFMPWNEVSRRYVDDEPEFYFGEYRERSADKKQGSGDLHPQGYGLGLLARDLTEKCLAHYNYLIEQGVAPEQARDCLPLNMQTEWIWSGTLGAWADMLHLRLDPHTQYESQLVAQKARDIILPLFPVALPALLDNK